MSGPWPLEWRSASTSTRTNLGLAKVMARLRWDVTYPGDPGGTVKRHARPPCPIATTDVDDDQWIPVVAAQAATSGPEPARPTPPGARIFACGVAETATWFAKIGKRCLSIRPGGAARTEAPKRLLWGDLARGGGSRQTVARDTTHQLSADLPFATLPPRGWAGRAACGRRRRRLRCRAQRQTARQHLPSGDRDPRPQRHHCQPPSASRPIRHLGGRTGSRERLCQRCR